MKRGDIFWADLEEREGSVTKGMHPCVIVQNDIGNYHSGCTIICPITSMRPKNHLPTHVEIKDILPRQSIVQCEQVGVISKCRLKTKIGKISDCKMAEIDAALAAAISLDKIEGGKKMLETAVNQPEAACRPKKTKMIKEFSPTKIIFSDGTTITSKSGEFDHDVIKAILEAGE